MNTFLALDKDERLPLAVSFHLLACPECRSQVRLLTRAEHIAATALSREAGEDDRAVFAIMQKAGIGEKSLPNPISLKRWVVSGIAMVLLMLSFGLFAAESSSELKIAFYLVFALIITTYCAMFIGSNIDFFIKKISTSDLHFSAAIM